MARANPCRGQMRLRDLLGIGHVAKISPAAILRAREAPSMRPSPERSLSAPSVEGIWSVAVLPPAEGSDGSPGRFFIEGLLAAFDAPVTVERDRIRLPSQNASKIPSNFSQSDFRAENRCLKAERSRCGRAAKPAAIRAAASRPSARPTANPASRKVRRNAASLFETRRDSSLMSSMSGDTPQQLMRPSPTDGR